MWGLRFQSPQSYTHGHNMKKTKPPGPEVKVSEDKRKTLNRTYNYRFEQQNHKQTTLPPYYL